MFDLRVWTLAVALALAAGAAGAQSGLRDPTRPTSLAERDAAAPAARGPRWRLQSTLVAESRRLAVINGQLVAQGARIDGATLIEVRQDGVTLDVDGERVRLRVVRETAGVKRGGG